MIEAESGTSSGSPQSATMPSLDEFTRLREENLTALRAWKLTERELSLEGEHPERLFGKDGQRVFP